MPLHATGTPRAVSAIDPKARDKLEEMLTECLLTLARVEVLARAGTKKGKLGHSGIELRYASDDDDSPTEIADQVFDQIDDHHNRFGAHVYGIRIWVAGDDGEEQHLDDIVFIAGTKREHVANGNAKDEWAELGRHQTRTIKELDAIIVRQGKSAEQLVNIIHGIGATLKPQAEVELERIRAAEREAAALREHQEDIIQQETIREVLGPVFQGLLPSLNNYINSMAAKNRAAPGDTVNETAANTPPWERAANLLDSLSDEQRREVRTVLGDKIWTDVEHLRDVDSQDAFTAKVASIQEEIKLTQILKLQTANILSDEQSAELQDLIA